MQRTTPDGIGRREWLAGVVPACAAVCLIPCQMRGEGGTVSGTPILQEAHPFEAELKRPMTYRELMERRWGGDYIPIMNSLAERIGRAELLEMVRSATWEKNRLQGERMAQRSPDTSLRSLTMAFRKPNPKGIFSNSNVWEIVEDTESAFQIKLTKCLAAEVFLNHGAGDLGYASVCHADFGMPAGFNPAIELHRDRTLMEGDDHCNHRWVYRP